MSRRLVAFFRYHSDYYHSNALAGGGWVREDDVAREVQGYRIGDAVSLGHWSLEALPKFKAHGNGRESEHFSAGG